MQQQNDWYTGIDYFQSYKEQDIQVEEQSLAQPVPLTRHERVELWYVLKGDGDILVNGVLHTVQQDSFLCLYAHHLYEAKAAAGIANPVLYRFVHACHVGKTSQRKKCLSGI